MVRPGTQGPVNRFAHALIAVSAVHLPPTRLLLAITSITRNDIEQACATLSVARRIRPGLCAEDLAPITQSNEIHELRKPA